MKRRWLILLSALTTVALVGVAVPTAFAGELDNDPDNNRLKVRMSLRCNSDKSVTLKWRSLAPKQAVSMTARWYDLTDDDELQNATPAGKADQVAAVKRRGDRASGSFRIPRVPNRNGHRIAIFIDAWSEPGGGGSQVFGLGRNIDTIHC